MMTYTDIPAKASLVARKAGVIDDPKHGPYDGVPACVEWYHYTTPTQDKHYIVVRRDGEILLRKQATGRNVAAWRAAYDDMCAVIREGETW